jgi:hypothetical protein
MHAAFTSGLEMAAALHDLSFTLGAHGVNADFRRQEAPRMENVVHVTRRP